MFKENKRIIAAALALALSLASDPAAAVMIDAPSPAKPSKIKVETVADGLDHPWDLQVPRRWPPARQRAPGELRLVPAE
jgi:glucose/arabinose dehydrogenase